MLSSLQAGRAIAATAVAAFHLSGMMGEPRYGGERVFFEWVARGNLGVDFFFVLSGFIILYAHEKDIGHPGRWREYLRRRFVRVYPVYWLYTLLFVLAFAVFGGAGAQVPTGAVDIVTSATLVRFSDAVPPLPVAWSLYNEVLFYALFTLLIVNARLGALAFFAWALACLALFHHMDGTPPDALRAYTALCNLWFFFGMAAFLLYKRLRTGVAPLVVGAALLAYSATLDLDHVLWPFLLVSGLSLAIAGIARLEAGGHLRCPAWLVFVGNASYTIYLVHTPVSGVLLKLAMKSGAHAVLGGEATFILVLVGTAVAGCIAYALVEKPLLAWLGSPRVKDRAARATAAAAWARWRGARRT